MSQDPIPPSTGSGPVQPFPWGGEENVIVSWNAMQKQLSIDIMNTLQTGDPESLLRVNGYLSVMLPVVKAIADATPDTASTQTFLTDITTLQSEVYTASTTGSITTMLEDLGLAETDSQSIFANAPMFIPEQSFRTGLQNSLQNLLQTLQSPNPLPDQNTFQGMQIAYEDFSDSFEAVASPFTTQFNFEFFNGLNNDMQDYVDNGTNTVSQMISDINNLLSNPTLHW